jgi:murein peptide amidase A
MSGMSGQNLRRSVLALALALGLLCGASPLVVGTAATAGPKVETFSIGTSVNGRPLTVVHRAYPGARNKVLIIGNIHGDERPGLRVVKDLLDRTLPRNVDLYLLRTANPDGVHAHRRTNAHGVDLNRNFPYKWRSINKGTETWSGPAKLSEPESKALKRFVKKLNPALIVTFHQPLFGVGANTKAMPIVRAIAAGIHLPVRSFSCTSACYGSFTSWVNHRTDGVAVTVEFGEHAAKKRIRRAARTVLRVGSSL